jgi:hypothetical protein
MGNPTEPGVPNYGEDCLTCYAPGLTPRNHIIVFADITVPHPEYLPPGYSPNSAWLVKQVEPLTPCYFSFFDETMIICFWMVFSPTDHWLVLNIDGRVYFDSHKSPACALEINNDLTESSPGSGGWGGTASVYPASLAVPANVVDCMAAINLEPGPKLKYDEDVVNSTQSVLKFAKREDKTRIQIKFNT